MSDLNRPEDNKTDYGYDQTQYSNNDAPQQPSGLENVSHGELHRPQYEQMQEPYGQTEQPYVQPQYQQQQYQQPQPQYQYQH